MAVEAIANIKTVTSLGQEDYITDRYSNELKKSEIACRSKIRYRAIVVALGQAAPIFGYSISFYYGGVLVANQEIDYKNVIK